MAAEIERKFLVSGEFRDIAVREIHIIQAYLSVDPERIIRVRITEDSASLTVKSGNENGTYLKRKEWNIIIDRSIAEEIMQICLPGRIYKTRFIVPYGRHQYEVDVFHGANEGLIIAEIELTGEDEEFERPDWLGKEVTGDPSYNNSNLIK